jgi:hypothetical protein
MTHPTLTKMSKNARILNSISYSTPNLINMPTHTLIHCRDTVTYRSSGIITVPQNLQQGVITTAAATTPRFRLVVLHAADWLGHARVSALGFTKSKHWHDSGAPWRRLLPVSHCACPPRSFLPSLLGLGPCFSESGFPLSMLQFSTYFTFAAGGVASRQGANRYVISRTWSR